MTPRARRLRSKRPRRRRRSRAWTFKSGRARRITRTTARGEEVRATRLQAVHPTPSNKRGAKWGVSSSSWKRKSTRVWFTKVWTRRAARGAEAGTSQMGCNQKICRRRPKTCLQPKTPNQRKSRAFSGGAKRKVTKVISLTSIKIMFGILVSWFVLVGNCFCSLFHFVFYLLAILVYVHKFFFFWNDNMHF